MQVTVALAICLNKGQRTPDRWTCASPASTRPSRAMSSIIGAHVESNGNKQPRSSTPSKWNSDTQNAQHALGCNRMQW